MGHADRGLAARLAGKVRWPLAVAVAARRWAMRRAERCSRPELLELQRSRLDALLRHARERSPWYQRQWGSAAPRAEDLGGLPPLAKSDLVAELDSILTDPRLNRAVLARLLAAPGGGSHRVLATSGTTGEPVLIPYARDEWIEALALTVRSERRRSASARATFLAARRRASVMTRNPIHASTQLNASLRLPFARQLELAASEPLEAQVAALAAFQPTTLSGYPSAIDPLARSQLEGRLAIRPRRVLLGGETLAPAVRERIDQAWGAEVFDCYGLTETLVIAWECREHNGLHVDEDAVVIEVVDGADRPLPIGERGEAILVTNLYNRTLPLVRYRVGDRLRLDDAPCPCGAPFARIVEIDGRREELLRLRGAAGGVVEVSPMVIESPLEAIDGIRRFRLVEAAGTLRVIVEPRGSPGEIASHLRVELAKALVSAGADPDALTVEIAASVDDERGRTDKLRRVRK